MTRLIHHEDTYRRLAARPGATVRWVCFSHAGGTANAFRGWESHLPPTMELIAACYPGREHRSGTAVPADLGTLCDQLAAELRPWQDIPLVLFGHSMGALVGYEVARRLERSWAGGPAHLFVAGQPAPSAHRRGDVRSEGPEDRLLAELRGLGGIDEPVLEQRELRARALAVIRADLRLVEAYRPGPAPPLGCPVTAVRGSTDPEVTAEELGYWARHTRARFREHVVAGGHFAPVRAPRTLLGLLLTDLTDDQFGVSRLPLP
ncbi:thioesterase II family protein [Amycolatopsis sp. NPDC059021]|uniref:thioesterase II family protein n=1 Tax=Amycolatopsis sp. NPDC059021 TaxID=3346704 RepID=UPI00366F3AE1